MCSIGNGTVILLDYCRRHPKTSVKTGSAGTHGAEGRPVSVIPEQAPGGGIYNTPSQPNESLKDPKIQKDPFYIHFLNMAEIVIATRQAVSLNRFSANTK